MQVDTDIRLVPSLLSTRFQDLRVKILLLAGGGVVATLGAGGFELLQMAQRAPRSSFFQASFDQQAARRIFAAVLTEHLNTVRSLVRR